VPPIVAHIAKSAQKPGLPERLCIRHHSAVELVDRLVEAELIARLHDTGDRRRTLLALTDLAEHYLAQLSAIHLQELRRLRPALQQILDLIGGPSR
jgi:DNA-binding MarR family transcriptional regulator